MATVPDRIEQEVVLAAPLERVWRAVGDSAEFGRWFGAAFAGPFVAGERLSGRIVPTTVDPEVAAAQKPYDGTAFELAVERVEPMRRLAFRWHPYAVAPGADLASEPTTLVAFELEEAPGGTRLRITESGFDRVPAERRAEAYAANAQGWAAQATLVQKYLAGFRAP